MRLLPTPLSGLTKLLQFLSFPTNRIEFNPWRCIWVVTVCAHRGYSHRSDFGCSLEILTATLPGVAWASHRQPFGNEYINPIALGVVLNTTHFLQTSFSTPL